MPDDGLIKWITNMKEQESKWDRREDHQTDHQNREIRLSRRAEEELGAPEPDARRATVEEERIAILFNMPTSM